MKAIKLHLKQKIACYRIPTASGVWLSYPLPPYSTIYGFLRAICKQKEETEKSINYKNTKLSISGKYESTYFDLQTMHKEERGTGKSKTFVTEPYKVQTLYEVELEIHIATDEERISLIENGLDNPPFSLSLGRKEDLIYQYSHKRIEINFSERNAENYYKKNISDDKLYLPTYIPKETADKYNLKNENNELDGILFKVSLDSIFLREHDLRRMKFKKVIYMINSPSSIIDSDEKIYIDEDGSLVWL